LEKYLLPFETNVLPSSSWSFFDPEDRVSTASEMALNFHQITGYNISEDSILQLLSNLMSSDVKGN
jgi:hypothetical protein